MAEENRSDLISLAADVVSAYVSNNKVHGEDLVKLIGSTYAALKSAGQPAQGEPDTPKPDKAAVRKSISPDHLTSFIDGRQYKSLKRHLNTRGMTPGEYRERYGLASDYPMVASSYSAKRSELAKSLGLGRKAAAASTATPAPSKGRGRTKTTKAQDPAS